MHRPSFIMIEGHFYGSCCMLPLRPIGLLSKSEDVNTVHTLMYYVGLTEMFFKLLYLSPLRLNGKCLS